MAFHKTLEYYNFYKKCAAVIFIFCILSNLSLFFSKQNGFIYDSVFITINSIDLFLISFVVLGARYRFSSTIITSIWFLILLLNTSLYTIYLTLFTNFSYHSLTLANLCMLVLSAITISYSSFLFVIFCGILVGFILFFTLHKVNPFYNIEYQNLLPFLLLSFFTIILPQISSFFYKKPKISSTKPLNSISYKFKNPKETEEFVDSMMFFSNMNHEIRTYIHGIESISASLLELWSNIDDHKKLDCAKQIHNGAKKLNKMLIEVLNWSRFLSGNMNFLNKEEVDLISVINEILSELDILNNSKKNVKIIFNPNNKVTTIADKDRISQVIRNLLTNAIKFAHTDTDILINIKYKYYHSSKGNEAPSTNNSKKVEFSIENKGSLIEESRIKSIFNPFVQGALNDSRGTGLGLSISKHIIDIHKGEIWAENNTKNHSVIFKFTIPAKTDPAP